MPPRIANLVLLCEDKLQQVFVLRVLMDLMGLHWRQIRVVPYPKGSGDASHHVRETFPGELGAHRIKCNYLSVALVTVIDADVRNVDQRINDFKSACLAIGIQFRQRGERVAFFIPKRNIETWIRYLQDQNVDEETDYKYNVNLSHHERESDPQVRRLVEMCRGGGLSRNPPPPSLKSACTEYRERLSH